MFVVNVQIDGSYLIEIGSKTFRAMAVSPVFESREVAEEYVDAINLAFGVELAKVVETEPAFSSSGVGHCCVLPFGGRGNPVVRFIKWLFL